MIVTSLDHAKLVLNRFKKSGLNYIVTDTEGRAKAAYAYDDGAALTYGRVDLLLLVLSFRGESYGLATSNLDPSFPTPLQYGELLKPLWKDSSITKVAHNWIYDAWVLSTECELNFPTSAFWCTLTSSWATAEYLSKSLKNRALRYGRILRDTGDVDFSSLKELSEYGTEDGLATEELFLAHSTGSLHRKRAFEVAANAKIYERESVLPLGTVELPSDEFLTKDQIRWLRLVEFPVIAEAVAAQKRGFPVDVVKLREIRKQVLADRAEALKTIFQQAGETFNTGSTKEIARISAKLGIVNENKTKKGAQSFGAKAMSKLRASSGHPFIEALAKCKEVDKTLSVYVGNNCFDVYDPSNKGNLDSGYEFYVNPDTACIHSTVNSVGAITGRSTSDNPNLQQVPTRKDKYGIKECFVGTPKHPDLTIIVKKYPERLLLVLDYSQLELRVMGLLSRDAEMTRILSDPKGDIHNNTAEKFSVTRDAAKNLNFLLLYGGEAYMLSEALTQSGSPTTVEQASSYHSIYGVVHAGVVSYRKQLLQTHQTQGRIKLWCGRYRHIEGIDWSDKYSVHKAETQLSNNVVQGSGQDFLKASVVRLSPSRVNPDEAALITYKGDKDWRAQISDYSQKLKKYRHILKISDCRYRLQVHDELAFSVQPSAAEECLNICAEVMSWWHYVPAIDSYSIPLVAEGGVGYNWKHAKGKTPLFKAKHGL